MYRNNKAFFLSEALLSLFCVLIILTTFISFMVTMQIKREEAHLSYRMRQTLIYQALLLENQQPLLQSDEYVMEYDHEIICIIYTSKKEGVMRACMPYIP